MICSNVTPGLENGMKWGSETDQDEVVNHKWPTLGLAEEGNRKCFEHTTSKHNTVSFIPLRCAPHSKCRAPLFLQAKRMHQERAHRALSHLAYSVDTVCSIGPWSMSSKRTNT